MQKIVTLEIHLLLGIRLEKISIPKKLLKLAGEFTRETVPYPEADEFIDISFS